MLSCIPAVYFVFTLPAKYCIIRKAFYGVNFMEMLHQWSQPVTFGDCDPAGIVFYPHYFAWFDRTFHDWLRKFGGHAEVCKSLGAVGLGLMEVNAKFRAPLRDGDTLNIHLSIEAWDRKALRLTYDGQIAGRSALVGQEVRGLFKATPTGIIAGDMQELKVYLESHGASNQKTIS
jgi:4-hydroxybenzoyl-CoA thioesterase